MSKAEAQKREREVLSQHGDVRSVDALTKTVADLLDAWLKFVEPTPRSQIICRKTYERYTSIVRLHLKQHLGDIPLPKLCPAQIADAYATVRGKVLSGRSCLHVRRVLHTALQYGVKTLRWLKENPAAGVRAPKVARRIFAH